MQQGQIPEWFLRSKAILFTDVEAKDVVVSTGSARNGMPSGGSGRVSRCMDLQTNSSTGLRILAKSERRNRCRQTRMWKGLLRGCPCRRWSGGLQMKRGDVTLEIMTVMTLLTIMTLRILSIAQRLREKIMQDPVLPGPKECVEMGPRSRQCWCLQDDVCPHKDCS